jgi:hypothetical protein
MKIAFYLDPYICFVSFIYILESLVDEFQKREHELVIHIPYINPENDTYMFRRTTKYIKIHI